METAIIDPAYISRDTKLLGLAVRQGWNIPDRVTSLLPSVLADIAFSEEQASSDRIAAAKVLLAMKDRNDKAHVKKRLKRPAERQTIVILDGDISGAKQNIAERIAGLIGGSADSGRDSGGQSATD